MMDLLHNLLGLNITFFLESFWTVRFSVCIFYHGRVVSVVRGVCGARFLVGTIWREFGCQS